MLLVLPYGRVDGFEEESSVYIRLLGQVSAGPPFPEEHISPFVGEGPVDRVDCFYCVVGWPENEGNGGIFPLYELRGFFDPGRE